jgi:hypothetical protein
LTFSYINHPQEDKSKETYGLEGLLLLFQFAVDLGELFLGLVEFILNGLDLLLESAGLLFELQ